MLKTQFSKNKSFSILRRSYLIHEFEQTLGDHRGQRNQVCCSLWGRKELDATWRPKTTTTLVGSPIW